MQRQIVLGPVGVKQKSAWGEAWQWAWTEVKRVVMEVEMKVQYFSHPWVEAWTRSEGRAKPRLEVQARAWARERERRMKPVKEVEITEEMAAEVAAGALELAGILGWARGEAGARGESPPTTLASPSRISGILSDHHRYGAARGLWHNRYTHDRKGEYSCIIHFIAPVTRLPFELLRQIFLIIIDESSGPPSALMLVCKNWHAIVTSLWASLNLGATTPLDTVTKKLERNQWFLDVLVDTAIDRGNFTPSADSYDAIFAAIAASSRWRSLVVESFPAQADMPEDVVSRHLQRYPNLAMNRFTTFKIKSVCETSPLLDGLLHILGKSVGSELTTVEIKSANVISLIAPAYPSIFHSVKVLSLDTPGIPSPVDLLPHLHQLERFTASHISFPIYHNDVDLPFVHTLRHLSLRAVSIQWMSGRTFHVLENCTLIFPLHRQVLHTFSTTLPNCRHLTLQGYPLEILGGVLAHKLAQLSVTCSGSFNRQGGHQLVWLSRQVLGESRLRPRILHISIEATIQAWMFALAFMSDLEELVIHNARPSSIGAKVFQSLVVQPVDANNPGAAPSPGALGAPLCPSLRRLGLKYDRWLRPTEQFDLIPVFVSIIQSREHSNCSLESFCLWTTSGEQDPLELIEKSRMSVTGFEHLTKQSGIEGDFLCHGVDPSSLKASGECFPDSPATTSS